MNTSKLRRIERSYSPTGPMVRAALDFVAKWGVYHGFGPDFNELTQEGKAHAALQMFEARQVINATFSMCMPEREGCRQPFVITFAPRANGFSPEAKVDVESVAELRAQAKLYPRDSSAYSPIRKPRRKSRAIEKTL